MSHSLFPAPDRIGLWPRTLRRPPRGRGVRSDYDVGTLAARTGATVALASQHLAKLRLAGLVTARREGRRHIYAVEDPHVLTPSTRSSPTSLPTGAWRPIRPRHGDCARVAARLRPR